MQMRSEIVIKTIGYNRNRMSYVPTTNPQGRKRREEKKYYKTLIKRHELTIV